MKSEMDIGKYISLHQRQRHGKLSAAEEQALDAWLKNTEGANMAKDIERINQLAGQYKNNFEPDVDAGWAKMQARMQAAQQEEVAQLRVASRRSMLRIAAAVLLIVAAVAIVRQFLPNNPEMLTVQTAAGEQEEVLLTDGTRIVLNENSEITFPRSFAGQAERAMQLRGEAYFNVTPNPKQPFIVKTQQTEIKVLGTVFNVRAYAQEPTTEVEVAEGKVQFGVLQSDAYITLEANQKGVFDTRGNKLARKEVVALNAQAWRTHRLTFKNALLEEVFQTLERYYKIDIEVANPAIARCEYTSNFEGSDLSEVIAAMSVALDLRTEKMAADRYKVYGKGCQ